MATEMTVASDLPEVISSTRELGDKVSDIDQHVEKLLKRITSGSLSTKKLDLSSSYYKTISLCSKMVKYSCSIFISLLINLSYIIDLTYYLLTKTDGKSWHGDPAVERLVEARTVLEKVRPIDQKMKYQIDKMIKAATTGIGGAENDPLRFKPNPDNMVTKLDNEDSESSDEEDLQKKSKVYVPPKVAAVPYDEEGDKKTRKERDEERSRKRVLTSSLLQDLRDEYSEAPQEVRDETVSRWKKQRDKEEEEERTRYEEENLLRLPAKRKKKMAERTQSGLDDLTSFADLSLLNTGDDKGDGEYSTRISSSSNRKSKSKGKKKFGSAKKKKGFTRKRRR